MSIDLLQKKMGIAWCMNCCSYHPDEFPTKQEMFLRMMSPQQTVARQLKRLDKKLHLYRNMSCSLCGRSYDEHGELDTSWEITAHRVKQELDFAGIRGVDDAKIKQVVAQCRKGVNKLFEMLPGLQYKMRIKVNVTEQEMFQYERLTFSGQLALIITAAEEKQSMRLVGGSSHKIN